MTQGVTFITIDAEKVGQRIDNFLFTKFKGVPKSRLYRLVRSGELRVNKKRVEVSYRLQEGDLLRVPPIRVAPEKTVEKISTSLTQRLREKIIYEDDDLLLLNKPAGIAVHGGSGVNLGVIEALRQLYPKKNLELVHRLDRDTSGCLLVAKKRSALHVLHEAMREQEITKKYTLLVKGHWPKQLTVVEKSLRKNILRSGERVVLVDKTGKAACTHFHVETDYANTSLVTARLETGRTHQIRVHAASVHHPIAGDEKYGDKTFNRELRDVGLRRLFLHACQIKFRLPGESQYVTFTAPLDEELAAVLECLQQGHNTKRRG